jgi:hypothetical protein
MKKDGWDSLLVIACPAGNMSIWWETSCSCLPQPFICFACYTTMNNDAVEEVLHQLMPASSKQ